MTRHRTAGDTRRLRRRLRRSAVAAGLAILFAGAVLTYSPAPPDDAPRVLVSVDRSVWNRLGFNRLTYVRALRGAGLEPVLVDFEAGDFEEALPTALLDDVHALVLSGGGDVDPRHYGGKPGSALDVNPRRDEFELGLLRIAEQRGLPVLGICRGAQLINVYRDGTLGDMRADSVRYRRHHRIRPGHAVTLDADSRLARIFGQTELDSVVTFHGQFVSEPGSGVRIVGHAPDGTPEAIEVDSASPFGMLGVQWHAEVLPWDTRQRPLFEALRQAAVDYRARLEAFPR